MLIPIIFACGLVFLFLGLSKTSGFDKEKHPTYNEGISVLFFVYGFLQITTTLFLLNASIPFGSVAQSNVSDSLNVTYYYVNVTANQSVDCNFTCIKEIPVLLSSVETNSHVENYVYSTQGGDIVNFFFVVNLLIFAVYLFMFIIVLLKRIIERKKHGKENQVD
jgi:hypothetical protein